MSDDDDGERSEEATQQRRDDYRKRGQIAQTRELGSVLLLFAGVLIISVASRFFSQHIHEIFRLTLDEGLKKAMKDGSLTPTLAAVSYRGVLIFGPVGVAAWLVGFLATTLQTGFIYNEEALQLKWDRLDPVAGLQKLFTIRSLIEGGKSIAKICLILYISYLLLRPQIRMLPHLMDFSVPQLLDFTGSVCIRLLSGVGFFMLALAGLDYFYQRWELEKQMRMTKQEIKEEHKSREGDPMIRSRIKRLQREMSSKRMMADVPTADVIVTNPTHISIALKYDGGMVAPRVIAKGADAVAMKIREIAREHNIPIVENKPLARAIFKTLKIGSEIPRELYTAVAEVLSYVYRLRRKKKN